MREAEIPTIEAKMMDEGVKESGTVMALLELEREMRGLKYAAYFLGTTLLLFLVFMVYVFVRLDALQFATKLLG